MSYYCTNLKGECIGKTSTKLEALRLTTRINTEIMHREGVPFEEIRLYEKQQNQAIEKEKRRQFWIGSMMLGLILLSILLLLFGWK